MMHHLQQFAPISKYSYQHTMTKTNIGLYQHPLINLLLLSLLFTVSPATQAQWIALDRTTKPGESHYFDPETLEKHAQLIKVWILTSFDSKQKGGFHALKSRYEFDCQQHRARPIAHLLYPDKLASGSVIGARHEESPDWFALAPQSSFQHIADTICKTQSE